MCRSRCFISYAFALHYQLLLVLLLVSLGTCFFRRVMSGWPVYSPVIYSNLPSVAPPGSKFKCSGAHQNFVETVVYLSAWMKVHRYIHSSGAV